MQRVLGWLDFRRGCATLAGSLTGAAIAAWEQAPAAAAVCGAAALLVGSFTLNAYMTRDRVEVALPPGILAGDGDAQHNVHLVPPES